MNSPRRSVLTSNFRVTPSANSMAITTPGAGLPSASTTLPLIMPVCAAAGPAASTTATAIAGANHLLNIDGLLNGAWLAASPDGAACKS